MTPEEEAWFDRWYGPWDPWTPDQVADLLDGFDRPWWFVGGWAVEAFTGVARDHEDVDVSVLACDLDALRHHVGDRYCLWSMDGGTLRPFDERHPEVLDVSSQLWVRESALTPWLVDLPITPDRDGRWTNKRLPDDVRGVDEATWVAADGRRHLRPEIALLYKARLARRKDEADLLAAWPRLGAAERTWLLDGLAATHGADHPWWAVLGEEPRGAVDGADDGTTAASGPSESA